MSRALMVERIKRHLANGDVSDDFAILDAEIYALINEQVAQAYIRFARANYQIEGVYDIPEGALTRFKFSTYTQDADTEDWFITLPTPPIGLPLGYSITSVLATNIKGVPVEIYPIREKRLGMLHVLPRLKQPAYYVIGKQLFLTGIDLSAPTDNVLLVNMVSPRDGGDQINLPDDELGNVFTAVVKILRERYLLPQDNNNDGNDTR